MKLANTVMYALSYTAINETEVIELVIGWICAIILLIGVIYGGWELAQGFMDQQPGKTKQGITALIVGVSVASIIYAISQLII